LAWLISQRRSGGAARPFILLSAARSKPPPANPLILLHRPSANTLTAPPRPVQIGNTARTLDAINAAAVNDAGFSAQGEV
jgi:hypothetical protein